MSKDKSNVVRFLDPKNARLSGQERVNAEIFTAIEILGRKLERTEAERDHLAERLEMIESAASLDEETGKIYLPAVIDDKTASRLAGRRSSKTAALFSSASFAMAALALGLTVMQNPGAFEKLGTWYTDTKALMAEYQKTTPLPAKETVSIQMTKPVPMIKVSDPKPVVAPIIEEAPEETKLVKPKVEKKSVTEKTEPTKVVKKTPPPKKEAPNKTAEPKAEKPKATVAAPANVNIDSKLPNNLKSLEKLALSGAAEAQHDLGIIYAEGRLVPTNYDRAVFWLEKASRQGVANATYNLAVIYQQGLGVETNKKGAIALYEEAAAQGHAEAMYNLGIIHFSGDGTSSDAARGAEYFEQAANAGVIEAAYNLGVLNESNFMGEIDLGKAIKWYEMAAAQGYRKATDALARIRGAEDQSITEEEKVTVPN